MLMDFSGTLKVTENHSFYLIVLEMVRRQISQYFVFLFVLSLTLLSLSVYFLLDFCFFHFARLFVCVMYVVICVYERKIERSAFICEVCAIVCLCDVCLYVCVYKRARTSKNLCFRDARTPASTLVLGILLS